MTKPVALIAGASGTIGTALAHEFCIGKEWTVYGVARRPPRTSIPGVHYLQCDLDDYDQCSKALSSLAEVTHVYYCGRFTHAEQVIENADDNLRLLANLLDSVERVANRLSHVHLVQGGKYYGVHIGPFPTPARENDPRAAIENFNYEQQDFLESQSRQANWSWTASRPNTLLHCSPDIARNLVSTLGAYAAISRELGAALDFPGPQGAYDSITQVTSLDLLARAIAWMSTEPACANQGFNITNTDVFRWRSLWPKIAGAFKMPTGSVRPLRLTEVLSQRGELWQHICEREHLQQPSLEQVANWGYADATLERYWDEILCHNKTRAAGFDEWDNSESRFLGILQQYRVAGILPE